MGLKSLELKPSRDNLLKTLTDDLLDRNIDVWKFASFCDAQESNCSIAIDARWGTGKTFFVRQVQLLMEAFNHHTSAVTGEERSIIRKIFAKYIGSGDNSTEFRPEVCIYYDAWANDDDNDPILSLIYEITKGSVQNYTFKKSTDYKKAASLVLDFFTGKNAADIVDWLNEKNPLSELETKKEIHVLVNDYLNSLLPEQGDRLIVFIDELDRCKPEYAVRLLERIKHYFSNDRITFVFSVNIEQLQHTVKCYYGEGFDACRYLDRFFDYRIPLPPANMSKYYNYIGLNYGSYVYEAVCRTVIDYCGFGLREIEKFYRMAKIAAFKRTHNNYNYCSGEELAVDFSLMFIVPIIIGLNMKDISLCDDFIEGKNPKPLIDIIGSNDFGQSIRFWLLSQSETYDENPKDKKTIVRLEDKLMEVYRILFVDKEIKTSRETHIGSCLFSKDTKYTILKVISLLSGYAKYE